MEAVRRRAVPGSRKLAAPSLILFLRQFNVLLKGELPIPQALFILRQNGANARIRSVADYLHKETDQGALLSSAMRTSGSFSDILVAMVQSAEESGSLADVLASYGKGIERNHELKKKMQTALVYPVLLTVISIVILLFLLAFVIPSFVRLFADAQVLLPLPTRILLGLSEALSRYGKVLALLLGLIAQLLLLASRTQKGAYHLARLRHALPGIGSVERDLQSAQLAAMLAMFYESNVNLLHFLTIMADGTDNPYRKSKLIAIKTSILDGKSVHRAFKEADYFSPVFTSMIQIGEASGQLSHVMGSIASYMDMEAELKLRRSVAFAEPTLILLMSFLVGFIVLAIAMPMFEMIHLYDVQ